MSEIIAATTPASATPVSRFKWLTWKKLSAVLALAIVVVWYFGSGMSSNSSRRGSSIAGDVAGREHVEQTELVAADRSPSDAEYRARLIGTWEMERKGRRVLTVREDGTATMDVTIENRFGRMLLGERITLYLDWTIDNGILNFMTTGGEPSGKVSVLLSMYGKERSQEIITLNETTLHHPDDEPDGDDHIWTRIAQ
jgi:hypothetical protein